MTLTRRAMIGAGLTALTLPAALSAKGRDEAMPKLKTIELRQYTLFGGRRDRLIDLFERNFIAPQNALGAQVLGSFTDLDDPDRFVWLRGFADMQVRGEALPAFYGGPIWQAHREAANATMRDSDNALLLRLLSGSLEPRTGPMPGCYAIDIQYLDTVPPERFSAFFETSMRARLADAGTPVRATLATESAPNNFPRLPVRQKERVFVTVASFASLDEMAAADRRRASMQGWRDDAPQALLPALMRKPERLRLRPTRHSPHL